MWTGRSASYSHLKVFRCKAFAHVPKEKRSKLDDKAMPCIFLGYVNEDVPDTAEPEAAGAANDDQENQVQDDHDQGESNQE